MAFGCAGCSYFHVNLYIFSRALILYSRAVMLLSRRKMFSVPFFFARSLFIFSRAFWEFIVIFAIRCDNGRIEQLTGYRVRHDTLRGETHKIHIAHECAALGIWGEVKQGEIGVSTVVTEFTPSVSMTRARAGLSTQRTTPV
jgi:hypothetical protein